MLAVALISMGVGCKSEAEVEQQLVERAKAVEDLDDAWIDQLDEGDDSFAELEAEPAVAGGGAVPSGDPATAVLATPSAGQPADAATDPDAASPGAGASPVSARGGSGGGSAPSEAGTPTDEPGVEGAEGAEGAEAVAPEGEGAELAPAPEPEPAPAPAAPTPVTAADYHGSFRYVGGAAQEQDLADAINVAVEQLPAAFRGIGRRRLTKTNPIDPSLDITIAGDKITTVFTSGFDATCTIDAGFINWTGKKGSKYKVKVRQKDTKLIQVIVGDDGVKTTVFVLSSDRQRLTVHHKITADRLPEPMTYRLSYARR